MTQNKIAILVFALFLPLGKGCAVAAGDMGAMAASAAGVPQIPAFLPMQHTVAKSHALAIDGIWKIDANGKRIRIEEGRAYAVDPWVHAFTLKIAADMVVMKEFRRTDIGVYAANDLPLLAASTFRLQPTGQLAVIAQTLLGPISYKLLPVGLDSPNAFNRELKSAGFNRVSVPNSGLGDVAADDEDESEEDEDEDEDEDNDEEEWD